MSYRNDSERRSARSYNRSYQKAFRRNPRSGKSLLFKFTKGVFGKSRSSSF